MGAPLSLPASTQVARRGFTLQAFSAEKPRRRPSQPRARLLGRGLSAKEKGDRDVQPRDSRNQRLRPRRPFLRCAYVRDPDGNKIQAVCHRKDG
jgi:hypothetical protein